MTTKTGPLGRVWILKTILILEILVPLGSKIQKHRALLIGQSCRSDVLKQPVGDDEIVVKTETAGVVFRDLLLVLGTIPWTKPGFEGAGVVVRTGSGVVDLKPGDRVAYGLLKGGSFATYAKMPSGFAFKIPDDVSSADAATVSEGKVS